MTNDELKKELAELRSQLEALRQQSVSHRPVPRRTRFGHRGTDAGATGDTDENEVTRRLRGFFEDLEEDLAQAHPLTILAVFGVGLLMGRLFSK